MLKVNTLYPLVNKLFQYKMGDVISPHNVHTSQVSWCGQPWHGPLSFSDFSLQQIRTADKLRLHTSLSWWVCVDWGFYFIPIL